MAAAGDHLPGMAAHVENVAVADPPHGFRDAVPRIVERLAQRRESVGHLAAGTVIAVEFRPAVEIVGQLPRHRDMALQPFRIGHPQRRAVAFDEPSGKAHVVGMEMGADHADDRRVADHPGQHLVPDLLRPVDVVAGIDDRPAVAVDQQPQIDVIERERQRHPHPVDAGHDLEGFAVLEPPERVVWLIEHGASYRGAPSQRQYGSRKSFTMPTIRPESSSWGKWPRPSIISIRARGTARPMLSSCDGSP